jgi:hypothetical protein
MNRTSAVAVMSQAVFPASIIDVPPKTLSAQNCAFA